MDVGGLKRSNSIDNLRSAKRRSLYSDRLSLFIANNKDVFNRALSIVFEKRSSVIIKSALKIDFNQNQGGLSRSYILNFENKKYFLKTVNSTLNLDKIISSAKYLTKKTGHEYGIVGLSMKEHGVIGYYQNFIDNGMDLIDYSPKTLQKFYELFDLIYQFMSDIYSSDLIIGDVKDDNIMIVEAEGSLKLILIDLDTINSGVSSISNCFGSIIYTSPNKPLKSTKDQLSDLYSFGMVLLRRLYTMDLLNDELQQTVANIQKQSDCYQNLLRNYSQGADSTSLNNALSNLNILKANLPDQISNFLNDIDPEISPQKKQCLEKILPLLKSKVRESRPSIINEVLSRQLTFKNPSLSSSSSSSSSLSLVTIMPPSESSIKVTIQPVGIND